MPTFDFIPQDPAISNGFVYKNTSVAYVYYPSLAQRLQIGTNSTFVATTGTGTSVMNISSVASGVVAAGQLVAKTHTVTFGSGTTTVNWSSHGFSANQIVQFSTTGALPVELSVYTNYYIISTTTNSFTISSRQGGNTITFSSAGTGTHTGYGPVGQIASLGTFDGINQTSGTVNLTSTLTWTNPTTFAGLSNYPKTTVKGIAYLDGTYYVMDGDGRIWGSGLTDPTYWSSLNVIQCQTEPSGGVAIAKQLSYIVGFTKWCTEFFYDAGNAIGSPLLPYQSALLEIGCATGDSIAQTDNTLYFMGVTKQKGRGIYRLVGTAPEYVSNTYIDRLLNTDNLSNVSAFCIRISGHIFYVLYLGNIGLTLVLDSSTGEWAEWTVSTITSSVNITSIGWSNKLVTAVTSTAHGFNDGDLALIAGNTPSGYNGTYTINVIDTTTFTYDLDSDPGVNTILGTVTSYTQQPYAVASYTASVNQDIIQNSITGYVYLVDSGTYVDDSSPIDVLIRTFKADSGNNIKKFVSETEIIGDKVDSTAYIRYTNDDYQTWSKYRPVDLNTQRSKLNRLGQTRRRAYEVRHHDNVPLRLESLETTLLEGTT